MTVPNKLEIVIVDDHPVFLEGLITMLSLEDDIVIVGQASDGVQALAAVHQLKPNIVILDINLPTLNGLQVARQIRAMRADVRIVVLTGHHEREQMIHALRAGANAYCSKDMSVEMIVQVIRDVARGYEIIDEQRLSRPALDEWLGGLVADLSRSYVIDGEERYIPLSPREVEILQFVTNGLSNKEIASELHISQQTVKNHMTSILKKLNVQDRTQAAVTALRNGWVRVNNG